MGRSIRFGVKPGLRSVALLGGSFDPVHLGHTALARSALDQLQVDQLWWIPVGHAWQKQRTLSPAEHRLAMLDRAIGRDPRQRIETCEIERPGPSYMIDTVEDLSARHPGVAWTLVLGWDQFLNLPTWHRFPDLLQRVRLAVAPRPLNPAADPGSAELPVSLRQVPTERLHLAPWDVSSSAIRADAAQGRLLLDRVAAPVARYIADHHLYSSGD